MSPNETNDGPKRLKDPHLSNSFTRMDALGSGPFPRSRANTIHGITTPEIVGPDSLTLSSDQESVGEGADVFDKSNSPDSSVVNTIDHLDPSLTRVQSLPSRLDELPIELISLTDR